MNKLVLALALVAPLVARADDGTTLPFNPFEKAEKGDWSIRSGSLKAEGANEKKVQLTSLSRVSLVDGDSVSVKEQENGSDKPTKTVFSKKKTPTLEELLGLKDGKVTYLKVEDEKKKLDDKKELACKKITFTWTQAANKYEGTVWLSPEVKAGGIVALTLKGHEKGINQGGAKGKDGEEHKADLLIESVTKLEVTGWGSGEKADWGDAPDDDDDDTAMPLPIDPFANAKKGDWAAYKVDVDAGSMTEKAVINYEVTHIKKAGVKLDRSITGKREDSSQVEFSRDEPIEPGRFITGMIKSPRDGAKVTGTKIKDDKKTIDGKEFACKRMSFTLDDNGNKAKVKLWLSADVRATGIVAMEVNVNERGGSMTITMELGGYGDGENTTWGKTADKLGKKKKKSDDDE